MQTFVGQGIVVSWHHRCLRRRREWTAIREIRNLAAMVAPRAAAPLGIGRAGTGIHDLKINGRRVAGFGRLVVGAVLLGANQLKAFAAAQIVVIVTGKIGPKLGVVVAVRGRKIPPQRDGRRVGAKIRVCLAECRALPL